ncbi:MAG: FitA-like ribbon-helix-helix domain-containing protein [Planctomycetota bacterium]
MSTLTIRKLDETIKGRLRLQAAAHGRSMEEEVRQILARAVSGSNGSNTPEGHPRTGAEHPLEGFAGTWVDDPEFDAAVASFETIDEELWQ